MWLTKNSTDLSPSRLLAGIDYNGDLCDGDLDVRYWMNPNQVYDSGEIDNPFKIINARSICLRGCPSPSATGNLSWVCDYPEGPIALSKKEWANQNYDYYVSLTLQQQSSSRNLTGPCYPVLFQSTNCKFDLFQSRVFNISKDVGKCPSGSRQRSSFVGIQCELMEWGVCVLLQIFGAVSCGQLQTTRVWLSGLELGVSPSTRETSL